MASPTRLLVQLATAGSKRARSWLRGIDDVHPDWAMRAQACQRCPLLHIDGKRTYCGRPFLRQIDRHEPTEGCGCPINAKAKDPEEHCPRNANYDASTKDDPSTCDCVWCTQLRH